MKCPTPQKKSFATRRGAEHFAFCAWTNGVQAFMRAYRCPCGWWHVATDGGLFTKTSVHGPHGKQKRLPSKL